uniref:Zinc fingers and homeoboxes 3a n=1 Tax=Hucho hucho TaxID=62062 RepID=A0A4W5PY74_9TELE
MASKRKSTVPCMIPSKSKHMREEIILEDSILSISGEEGRHFFHDSSRPEGGDRWQKGGTYSCPPCRFESRDLNYFLDHLHSCHIDFRAQPSFFCLICCVSVVRFEALALHNSKAHPGVSGGSVTVSLHVRKSDGATIVEQSLFTTNGEDSNDPAISFTKTPIVRMMKAKGQHKKIVVSHTVEVPPTFSFSSSYSESSKNLPKVMIPLSSIPTYDAAMDTSSFLKTSFGKFPYPTKAELCYLTVVSDWPEELIKLWFTAHRLKQGISWSPEEIEEARRKMFNTVFQGTAPPKQPPKQRHNNYVVTQHTVHAQPAPVGPSHQAARVSHGSVVSRHAGVIATSASISATGHPVTTRVSYASPTMIPPKYQTVVSGTTQVVARNTIPTTVPSLEFEKSVALRLANQDHYPSTMGDDDRNNNNIHKSNNGSISSGYSSTSNNDHVNNLNHASKAQNENTSTSVITKSSSSGSGISIVEDGKCTKEVPMKAMSVLRQLIKDEDHFGDDRTCPEVEVDPIKINLQAFSSTRWPSSQLSEELSIMTGLPKPEVVRWFSDSRYIHKNSQLKWLEGYQCLPAEGEEGKGHRDHNAGALINPQEVHRKLVEQEVNKQLDGGPEGLSSGQQGFWWGTDTQRPLLSPAGPEETGERERAVETGKAEGLHGHWAEREDDHQQPVTSQAFGEQQTGPR